MRTRHHLVGTKVALLLIFGIVGGILFARGGLTSEAGHLSPVPSFHVDIGSSNAATSTGNTYNEDPDGDGDNPAQIQFFSSNLIPFAGGSNPITGQAVGLLNLPVDPLPAGTHAAVSPASAVNNTDGAVFLGGTYQGTRTFATSTESGPSVDGGINNVLPDRNAGQAPDGGVFIRITWRLKAPSSGQDVLIDLTRAGPMFTGGTSSPIISNASKFITLLDENPPFNPTKQENIVLGGADLFDGIISVNKASPDPCPPEHELEAKGIGGTKNSSDLKVFKTCLRKGEDPCTTTQNHHLLIVNNSDHIEDIPFKYEVVGWPAAGTLCTVNGQLGPGPIEVLSGVESGVPTNASRNITVPVTFSCPSSVAGVVVGTNIQLRLTVEHPFPGSNDNDADPSNDIFIKGKTIK